MSAPARTHRPLLRRFVALVLLAAGLVWLLAREAYFSGWVDDDAFISFRYARNLAEGHGLVFNPGERVEGYSNFLWTLALAAAYRVQTDLPAVARAFGTVASMLAIGLLLWAGAAGRLRREASSWLATGSAASAAVPPVPLPILLLGPLVLCTSESWAAWAVGGLENTWSACLVLGLFVAHDRYLESCTSRALAVAALCGTLAVLVHPTNGLFLVVVTGHLLLRGRRRQVVWGFLVPTLTILVAHEVWRWSYYGDPLPNTWYAKGGFAWRVLGRGMRYLGSAALALPLAFAVIGLGAVRMLRADPRNLAWLPVVLSLVLYIGYVLRVGGEEFPAWRAFVVTLPLVAWLLQGTAIRFLALAQRRWGLRGARLQALAWTMTGLLVLAHALPLYASARVRVLDEAIRLDRTGLSRTAAAMLREVLRPDPLFAHSGAGLLAYYTNFRWIDTLGLTDRHIARTPVPDLGAGAAGHEKGDGAYVWSRQPDYIMFPGYPISDLRPGTKGGRELWAMPEFHQRYRPMRLAFSFQDRTSSKPKQYMIYLYERVP